MPTAQLKLGLFILTLTLTACSSAPPAPPTPIDDPITFMMDTTQHTNKRWQATRQAQADHFDSPQRIIALQRLVYLPGYPADFSNYAVDQLIEINETNAQQFLSQYIVQINDWLTLQHIFDIAVARNWTTFIPALVHNYSQTTPVYKDLKRPERLSIQQLAPNQSPHTTILQVFTNTLPSNIHQRTAAWQLLCRLAPSQQAIIDQLTNLPITDPTDTFLIDLQSAARDLNIIPTNRESVTWLRVLQTQPYHDIYTRMKNAVAQLNPQQTQGLQLRHLTPLVYLTENPNTPPPHTLTRQQLLDQALSFNAKQTHHLKGPTYDGPMDQHPQNLRSYIDQLTWPDLLTITLLQKLITDPVITAPFFTQADADLLNKTTEFGGLLRLNNNAQPTPIPYPPATIRHDLAYHPPTQLVIDGYTALAHYHFHAQKYKNKIYAGPGLGDLKRTAQTLRFTGLVITFINQNQLNVDYYQNPQTVIDLGTINR